jgi:glycosyltransferase involved in cell wall biosynthesis
MNKKSGETGELFKVRDASDMARVIAGMLADRNKLDHMGAAARRHADAAFDIRFVISRHLDIYEDLLSKS